MITPRICPDHLLGRARAGTLSSAERTELEAHLDQCRACRVALEVGQAFDTAIGPRPGDDQLAARMWMEVERRRRKPSPRRPMLWAAVAASVIFLSLTAGAMVPAVRGLLPRPLIQKLFSDTPPPPAAQRRAGPPATSPEFGSAPPPPAFAPPSPPAPPPSIAPGPAEEDSTLPSTGKAPPPLARPLATANVLFSQANAERRRGDTDRALLSYRKLQRHYPGSPEELVSRVALGRLLQRMEDPTRALREFDSYLGRAPQGPLAEEALFGKASALMRLGREREEKQTWRVLLTRFPNSLYADRARARLEPPQ